MTISKYSTDIKVKNTEESETITVKVKGDTELHDEIYNYLEKKLDSVKKQAELKLEKKD